MVEHKCLKCNKIFGCKSNYIRHINRKKPCDHVLVNPENICQVCNKNNASYYSMYENGPTHCYICKEDGMRIYIHRI